MCLGVQNVLWDSRPKMFKDINQTQVYILYIYTHTVDWFFDSVETWGKSYRKICSLHCCLKLQLPQSLAKHRAGINPPPPSPHMRNDMAACGVLARQIEDVKTWEQRKNRMEDIHDSMAYPRCFWRLYPRAKEAGDFGLSWKLFCFKLAMCL